MKLPLEHLIYEILREKGSITDTDLLAQLNDRVDTPVGMRDLNRALLRLEINGLATVTWISREQRRVELQASRAGVEEG